MAEDSKMNRDTMLILLSDEGEIGTGGGDHDDSQRVHGRFNWTIDRDRNGGGVLSVTYEDQEKGLAPITRRWVMVPMDSPVSSSPLGPRDTQ